MDDADDSHKMCVLLRVKSLSCESGDGGEVAEFVCSPPLYAGNPYICVSVHHAQDNNTYITVSSCIPNEFQSKTSVEDYPLGEVLQERTRYDDWVSPVFFMDSNDYFIYVLESMEHDGNEGMLDYATQLLNDIDVEVKFAIIPPVSLFVAPPTPALQKQTSN